MIVRDKRESQCFGGVDIVHYRVIDQHISNGNGSLPKRIVRGRMSRTMLLIRKKVGVSTSRRVGDVRRLNRKEQ